MEYIPDGITKKQWEEMKKKEEEALKKKNLGAVGITKFQSRYMTLLKLLLSQSNHIISYLTIDHLKHGRNQDKRTYFLLILTTL